MVAPGDVVVIDLTFLLESAEKSFRGAPLIVGPQGEDNTVLYGVIRDLLKLRNSAGIGHAITVIGKEANTVSSEGNVRSLVHFLRRFGAAVVYEPTATAAALCKSLASVARWVVTRNRALLQLTSDDFGIILPDAIDGQLEVVTVESLRAGSDIRPDSSTEFLGLDRGRKKSTLHEATGDSASRSAWKSQGASPGRFSCFFTSHEAAARSQRESAIGPSRWHDA